MGVLGGSLLAATLASVFLTRRAEPVPGTCLTVTLEGRRPLVAEVQALTVDSQIPSPRRTTSGLETSRVSMMLAVLEQRGRISALGKRDIYSATVGGVKLSEPAADLAVALALASAASDIPLPKNLVAIGEVGLAGGVTGAVAAGGAVAVADAGAAGVQR